MTSLGLAAIYSDCIVVASLVGGWLPQWLPRWLRLTHGLMQILISLVAGVVLGIGLLHLLPHGFYQWTEVDAARAIDRSVWWLLVRFLATFFLQRLFHFHTHEAPDALFEVHSAAGEHRHHQGECAADHSHAHTRPGELDHRFTWGGVFFGLTVHSLVDGIALAAAIAAEWDHSEALPAGFAFFLAVLFHKPFDSLSITSLMLASGWSAPWRNAVNFAYALVAPIGVLAFYFGLEQASDVTAAILGGTLCFAAGACLCIASSDLLPELQFHSHDRLKLSIALAAGLTFAWGLVYLENQGHDHHLQSAPGSHHHGDEQDDRENHGHEHNH
jgi:zinc and cadmium transporter